VVANGHQTQHPELASSCKHSYVGAIQGVEAGMTDRNVCTCCAAQLSSYLLLRIALLEERFAARSSAWLLHDLRCLAVGSPEMAQLLAPDVLNILVGAAQRSCKPSGNCDKRLGLPKHFFTSAHQHGHGAPAIETMQLAATLVQM
jgi:hypothetical protein